MTQENVIQIGDRVRWTWNNSNIWRDGEVINITDTFIIVDFMANKVTCRTKLYHADLDKLDFRVISRDLADIGD